MKEKITFIALLVILVLTALALVITCAYALNHAYAADEGLPSSAESSPSSRDSTESSRQGRPC